MKNKVIPSVVISCIFFLQAQAQEYKVITIIESITPLGIGRSRIFDTQDTIDFEKMTASHSERRKMNRIKRSAIRTHHFNETKMLNFYR